MKRQGNIVQHSAEHLNALRRRGRSRTNWNKVDEMTEAELEASIAADPDDVHDALDWTKAIKDLPPPKQPLKLRIDADVLAWFRATGRGYQTRMNNVLRAFVESRNAQSPSTRKQRTKAIPALKKLSQRNTLGGLSLKALRDEGRK